MSQGDLEIRDVSVEDVPALAAVHELAFAGTLGVSLGGRYLEAMIRWYLKEPGAINLIGRKDGAIAGYVFGAADGHWDRFNRDLLPTVALSVALKPWVLAHAQFLKKVPLHVRSVFAPRAPRLPPPGPPPVYNLCGIGVAPGYRGQGVAASLIDRFETRAWSAGFSSMILSVYADNTDARRLYESHRWRVVSNDGQVVRYQLTRGETSTVPRESR